MQLDLPLADHVERARALQKAIGVTRAQMFITYHAWSNKYWLERRTFDGPEVEWQSLLELPNRQAALDIKAAGICTDWLDCLED